MKAQIYVSVKGFVRLGTEEQCREFVDVLMQNNLPPLKYGTSDRPRNVFKTEDFVKFWTEMEKKRGLGIPFIRGDGFYVSVNWGGAKPYYTFLVISGKKFFDWDSVIKFTKDLYNWNNACYGYIKLEKEYSKELATPGYNIINCLGGITWANFFGKPYIDMWGEEKLLNAPTYKTERLDDGGFLLVTTESPLTDPAIAAEAEAKLRAYLGEEHFYKCPTGEPERITREELYERVFGNHEPEPTGYVAPNFGKYYDLSVK